MYTNCDEIFKLTIPAARIAVARTLNKRYEMNQEQIARNLGLAQAAVSKYLNGRYSQKIKRVEWLIVKKRYAVPIARMIIAKKDRKSVLLKIDELAANGYVVKEALKLI